MLLKYVKVDFFHICNLKMKSTAKSERIIKNSLYCIIHSTLFYKSTNCGKKNLVRDAN